MSGTVGEGSSIPARLLERAETTPDAVALRHKHLGIWQQYSWRDDAEHAARVGLGLRALGIGPGDRVAVHSENRPEWVFVDVGTQGIGAVTVGVYPTSPSPEVRYLLGHSGARAVVVEDEEQYDKTIAVWDELPELGHIIVVDKRGIAMPDDPRVLTLVEVEALGEAADRAEFDKAVAAIEPGEPAIIVYTSGTTGPPKGALISQHNMIAAADIADEVFGAGPGEEVLSYLPLCHVAERLFTVIDGISHGYVANFGEGGDSFATDLREVQPTLFLGVPRIWERMMATVQIRMNDASSLKRRTYGFWMKQGAEVATRRMAGNLSVLDRLRYRLGWLMLYRSLQQRLGLSRMHTAISGAAPVSTKVLDWYWSIGIEVREGYGQTENTASATMTPADDVRLGTVGVPVPGVEIRIADDGEILTRGQATFLGYLHNPEATAQTIDSDGWLHTGDIGEFDGHGHLLITDRKKDIIITAGGKNISPSEIENLLKVSPYVREAIVIGDRRKYLAALVGIESDTVGDWATRNRVAYTTYEDLAAKAEVHDLVAEVVAEANEQLAQVETIKQFRLLPLELDHEEGHLTATQKVKRAAIADQFEDIIEEMYT